MATLEKVRGPLPRHLQKIHSLRLEELRTQIQHDGELIIQMHSYRYDNCLGSYMTKLLLKETSLLTWDQRTKAVLQWEWEFIVAECDKIRMINRKRGRRII
jgi:hypothetical protein